MMSKKSSKRSTEELSSSVARFTEKLFAVRWFRSLTPSWQASFPAAIAIVLIWNLAAVAQNAPPDAAKVAQDVKDLRVGIDTMWVMVAGMLVIFMNAGFCMLEAGMCRQKNAVNVLAKNLIVFAHVGHGGGDAGHLHECGILHVGSGHVSAEKCCERPRQELNRFCTLYDRLLGDWVWADVQ